MRPGIGSYTYPWAIGVSTYEIPVHPMGIFGLMERAIALSVPVVQICENLPLLTLSPGELNTLTRLADDTNITIEIGARGLQTDTLRAYLRLAARLGSPVLRLVVDSAGDEPSANEVVTRLLPLMPDFASAGVVLGIENHDRFSAASLASIVERLGTDRTGIVLDTANSLAALESPDVTAATLGPYTVCFHAKDFEISRVRRGQLGFVVEGCPAGEGRVDFPAILSRLPRRDPPMSVILEQWTPFTRSIPETIAIESDWAERSLAYLRRLLEVLS